MLKLYTINLLGYNCSPYKESMYARNKFSKLIGIWSWNGFTLHTTGFLEQRIYLNHFFCLFLVYLIYLIAPFLYRFLHSYMAIVVTFFVFCFLCVYVIIEKKKNTNRDKYRNDMNICRNIVYIWSIILDK